MRGGEHLFWSPTVQTLDATGDKGIFTAQAAPIKVARWGVVMTVAGDVGAFAMTLDQTTHSESGGVTRSDGSGGTTLALTVDNFIGSVAYAVPSSELILRPGDFFTFQITTAMTAGDGYTFLEYQQLPFSYQGLMAMASDDLTNRITNGSTAAA